jgi:uncharacterized protein (TIGR00299 family) protein
MKTLYFDAFSGVSGDMTVGALLALGVPLEHVREELGKLPVAGYSISAAPRRVHAIAAVKFDVHLATPAHHEHPHGHRSFREIGEMIAGSTVQAPVQRVALDIFTKLAEAEGRVHGVAAEVVEFHEVGAVDAIVDIVSGCFLFEHLGAPKTFCSAIPGGSGETGSEHGKLPVPAPATLELLRGAPWRFGEGEGELVTPTGAALLRAFDVSFGRPPGMMVRGVGIGLGHREIPGRPNLLRVVAGDPVPGAPGRDRVLEVEANIDDMSPQRFELLIERALAAGALDVAILPATMKKNRPGWVLRLLCPEERLEIVSSAVFSVSTAIGLRFHACDRLKLDRASRTLETRHGRVRVKEATLPDGSVRPVPEYEDVKRIVRSGTATFDEVALEVAKAWRR